jgi:hypothetical protein
VVALLAAGSLPACTGDNLFTGVTGVGPLGPDVEITAPQNNYAMTAADSVLVTANVSSPNGVTTVKYSGLFSGGQTALTEIVVTLPNPQDSTVSRYMKPSGTTTGAVRVIVEATDVLGEQSADTVNVVIN